MGRYQLRILRLQADSGSPAETQSTWIEGDTADQAIAQAISITETAFSGWSGIAMLANEAGTPIWSLRKNIPWLGKPGGSKG